jgi:hypothetical protein
MDEPTFSKEIIKQTVLDFLGNQEVSIFLFGSRKRQDNTVGSDWDIGIIPRGKFNRSALTLLREELENLNIPYKVDLVDFSQVSEGFKNKAMKEIEWWRP